MKLICSPLLDMIIKYWVSSARTKAPQMSQRSLIFGQHLFASPAGDQVSIPLGALTKSQTKTAPRWIRSEPILGSVGPANVSICIPHAHSQRPIPPYHFYSSFMLFGYQIAGICQRSGTLRTKSPIN